MKKHLTLTFGGEKNEENEQAAAETPQPEAPVEQPSPEENKTA